MKEDYKVEAEIWLGFVRNPTKDVELGIAYCRKYLQKAGLSLSDIGTSEEELKKLLKAGYKVEEELKKLLKAGYKVEAEMWLGFVRNPTKDVELGIAYCRKYLQKAGLSLSDIGTSEKELETLREK